MALRLTSFSEISDLVRGSVDMHMHFGPDPLFPRRIDAAGAARDAQEAGMLAIVLKSHSYPTAPVAYEAQKVAPDVNIIGSICLDQEMGGVNPYAVQASADIDAKVCWLPDSKWTKSGRSRITAFPLSIIWCMDWANRCWKLARCPGRWRTQQIAPLSTRTTAVCSTRSI